jgi:RND family efflux transporter MFP subunit
VISLDPIHFYFEINQNDLLKYLRLDKEGKRSHGSANANPIKIKLQDEKDFIHQGVVDFVDNIIDPGTGTILARAIIPNADAMIYPGLFGRARLVGSDEYQAILLPDTAINTDQSRQFVYIVDAHNKVQRIYIELGPIRDSGFYIIRKGLTGQEKVVVNGIQRIRAPTQEVKPNLIQLQEDSPET